MKLNLSADEVLTTTRSVRKRLDFDRPVERAVVEECLQIAMQAPTGGNRQGWHWVVVEDAAKKQAIADVYRANFAEYRSMPAVDYAVATPAASASHASPTRPAFLADNFHRAPLMVIPCIWGRLDDASVRGRRSGWGSLLPAVWSFMLALRERAMGSAWTTIHLMNDGERVVAELLGIPYAKVTQAGCSRSRSRSAPTSAPPSASRSTRSCTGTSGEAARRREPLDTVLHWDRW